MKKKLEPELTKRFKTYIAQIKSYCEVVGVPYAQPTIPQFLEANALTRDRLMGDAPEEKKPAAATSRKPVTEANKPRGLLSFAAYVKQQEAATR